MRLETDDEFDDGGTPAWRARRARVIDVAPPGFRVRAWFKRTKLWKLLLWAIFAGLGVPWIILVAGLLGAYLFDRSTGRWP